MLKGLTVTSAGPLKEPQALPLACSCPSGQLCLESFPSSGALPQEEASLREGRLQTHGFLSVTYLGVYSH